MPLLHSSSATRKDLVVDAIIFVPAPDGVEAVASRGETEYLVSIYRAEHDNEDHTWHRRRNLA